MLLGTGYSTDNFLPNNYDFDEANENNEWEEKLDNIVKALKSSKN